MAEDKYETALDAIKDLFGDTSVPEEETSVKLQELKDEIDIMLDALQ